MDILTRVRVVVNLKTYIIKPIVFQKRQVCQRYIMSQKMNGFNDTSAKSNLPNRNDENNEVCTDVLHCCDGRTIYDVNSTNSDNSESSNVCQLPPGNQYVPGEVIYDPPKEQTI